MFFFQNKYDTHYIIIRSAPDLVFKFAFEKKLNLSHFMLESNSIQIQENKINLKQENRIKIFLCTIKKRNDSWACDMTVAIYRLHAGHPKFTHPKSNVYIVHFSQYWEKVMHNQ